MEAIQMENENEKLKEFDSIHFARTILSQTHPDVMRLLHLSSPSVRYPNRVFNQVSPVSHVDYH